MIVNTSSIVQHVIQIKNEIMKHANVSVKKIIVEIQNIADTSVTECAEIIIAMDKISTKKPKTTATNVTSTASINFHSKNARD